MKQSSKSYFATNKARIIRVYLCPFLANLKNLGCFVTTFLAMTIKTITDLK